MAGLDRSPGVDVPRTAMSVALFLKANGSDVNGDFQQGKAEGAIECVAFQSAVGVPQDKAGSGRQTGRRIHEGITIRKPIDRATPLLAKALCNNEVIEGTFNFFRPNPTGDGTTEHYFTVEIANGRVTRVHLVSPDGYANHDAQPSVAAFEDVQFTYNQITWRYEPTGTEHSDTWSIAY
jgi:type VI secretion system secreted protein Hcp